MKDRPAEEANHVPERTLDNLDPLLEGIRDIGISQLARYGDVSSLTTKYPVEKEAEDYVYDLYFEDANVKTWNMDHVPHMYVFDYCVTGDGVYSEPWL